jgi:hypothetical protein
MASNPVVIAHQLDIAAPCSVVFGLTVDIERWPDIMPTVISSERLDGGSLRVGSTARLRQPGQPATVWTVRQLEQDRLFVWDTTVRGVRTVARHLLEPTQTGMRNTLTIELSGRGARLAGLVGRKRFAHILEQENHAFRDAAVRLIETQPLPSDAKST